MSMRERCKPVYNVIVSQITSVNLTVTLTVLFVLIQTEQKYKTVSCFLMDYTTVSLSVQCFLQ